jgi:WD40 repeat protein
MMMCWASGSRLTLLRRNSILLIVFVLLAIVTAPAQEESMAPDWVAISADAEVAAAGSRTTGGIVISAYELDRGTLIHQMPLKGVELVSLVFSPDGNYLAAVTRKFPDIDESAQVFDVHAGTAILSFPLYNRGGGKWLAFAGSGAGETIVAAKQDSSIDEFSLASRNKVRSFDGFLDSVHAIAVSRDNRYLLAGGQDNTARLFDRASGKLIGSPLQHGGPVFAVAFARDAALFATGSADGHARIWKTPTAEPVNDIAAGWPILGIALSPDGASLGMGGFGAFICSRVPTGETVWKKNVTENGDRVSLAGVRFSSDGQKILALPDPGHARVYITSDGGIARPSTGQSYCGADFARDKPTMIYSRQTGTFTLDLISAKPVFFLDPKGSKRNQR